MSRDGPVVLIVDSPATVDWPPDHRDLIETIRVISKDVFAGGATITTTNGR